MIDREELMRVAWVRFTEQYGRAPNDADNTDVLRVWSCLTAAERAQWAAQDASGPMEVPQAMVETVAREVLAQGRLAAFRHGN